MACAPAAEKAATSARSASEPDPLIPLSTFFSGSSYDAPQLSPDGRWIAYLGPVEGTANFYLAPSSDPTAGKPLTHRTGRGIQARDVSGVVMYRWTLDSRYLIYPQDRNGDENWNLYRIDVASGEERDLTGLDRATVELEELSTRDPRRALISVREKMVALPQLWMLDLETGEKTLVLKNDEFLAFTVDHDLVPRTAVKLAASGGFEILRAAGGGKPGTPGTPTGGQPRTPGTRMGQWQPWFTVGSDDTPALSATGFQKIGRFDRDNRRSFFYDSRGRDTTALVAYDFETDQLEVLASDRRVDIGGVLYHPTEHRPQAYATNWTSNTWHALDPAIAPDLEFLAGSTEGEYAIVSRSDDDSKWIVRFTLAHEPETYHLYRRPERTLTKFLVTTPQLEGLRLSKMHPVVIESRDGLDLVSYLSFPPWTDGNETGRPSQPLPLILLVHGGPSDERAQYGYGPFVHWLTNRGYGLFYVNYRGSPGFGKAFVNAQRMEWGGKMHEDLLDQVEWAIAAGITTRDKVAILGGSYGGYAVLVGMTMTPEVFACGVDLVGPSNLEIFMPHWDEDIMSGTIGDPRTEEGRAFLRSRSPINFADQVKHPLLIGQGANDSRVPQSQSDSMVEVMKEKGIPVTYVLYPDEGHGLLRPENNASFWAITEAFLAQCLGGRYQEITDELEGSSAQVLAGAELVPGLQAALDRRDRK
jgi:dipeptidyl aminopeptidase/acylaminoacyl peptidase